MYLDFLDTEKGRKITKVARESSTFNAFYEYWRNNLFERMMRLFVWENTGCIQPKQIESRLLLSGFCGITLVKNEITAVYGNCGGGLAVLSALSDFVFMEEKNAKLFVNSPNALDGNNDTKLDTASAKFQAEAGLVDGHVGRSATHGGEEGAVHIVDDISLGIATFGYDYHAVDRVCISAGKGRAQC